MNIDDYKYLWDGSEPGWVLQHYEDIKWYVQIDFGEAGPSKDTISKLYKLVPELSKLNVPEVFRLLNGSRSFRSIESYGNIESRILAKSLSSLELPFQMVPENIGGYLPVFKDSKALIIDDAAFLNQVVKKMIEAGVPIVQVHVD